MTKKFEEYIIINKQEFEQQKDLFANKGEFTVVISPDK
jgi:hypothetical protein